jgi:hypothetical protein
MQLTAGWQAVSDPTSNTTAVTGTITVVVLFVKYFISRLLEVI